MYIYSSEIWPHIHTAPITPDRTNACGSEMSTLRSAPTSAIIYDAYTSIKKLKKNSCAVYSSIFVSSVNEKTATIKY